MLKAQIAIEEGVEGVLIQGLLGCEPEELMTALQSLDVPAVLLLEPDEVTAKLKEITTVLPADTPWATAAQTLSTASPSPKSSTAASPPADQCPSSPSPTPKKKPTRKKPQKKSRRLNATKPPKEHVDVSKSTTLLVYPVAGGVGATTLTLSLAAATARIGVSSLAASPDHMTIMSRTGVADQGYAQRIAEDLCAMILSGKELPHEYDLRICEIDLGLLSLVEMSHATVVIVTRPTGAGRLKAARAVHTLRRRGANIAAVIVARQGGLVPSAFERHCRSDDPDFPPVKGLPEDPEVWQTEDVTGHALDTPRYGSAVAALARELLPDLPWPIEDDNGNRPAHAEREHGWPIHIEFVD
jgi:hypothetical protein